MIFRIPSYYDRFRCIQGACKDSCCIGWEIGIDSETMNKYSDVKGEIGEKLRKNISSDNCFILGKDERCPFLNSEGLCELIINLGEESLCQICSDHPRFYNWYGDVKEVGLGLACEAAAKLILTDSEPFSFYETEIGEEADFDEEFEQDTFDFLSRARDMIIQVLQDRKYPLKERISVISEFAEKLQDCVDNSSYEIMPLMNYGSQETEISAKTVLEMMLNFEFMDCSIPEKIRNQINMWEQSESVQLPEFTEIILEKTALYFIWRYFLKGAVDFEVLSKVKFMSASISVLRNAFAVKLIESGTLSVEDCIEIVRIYSKEIEYSEDNMNEFLNSI